MRTRAPYRHRSSHLLVPQILLLVGASWLSQSASAASVKAAWADNVDKKQTFSRVLVVGISPNVDQRCPFERALVARIKNASTFAVASCDVVAQKNPLTRESIEAAVASQNADAVIATSLISKEWKITEGNGDDTRGNAYYKATDAYYGYYGTVVAADFQTSSSITTLKGAAHITSKVFETKGATVVYTIDTSVRNVSSGDAGLIEITVPIGKRLRKDSVVR